MKKKTTWLAQTAIMLALLIVFQVFTKPLGQIVTGSIVNMVLGITALFFGVGSGAVVALLSPMVAFLLGIAPQILTVPAIMAGNLVFVMVLGFWRERLQSIWHSVICCICAAAAKFAALYVLVVWDICHILADRLLQSGLLKLPMLKALTTTFTWPQLVTALIGGTIALCITPLLRKAIRR